MHLGKRPEQRQDPDRTQDSSRTAADMIPTPRRRQAAPPAAQAGSSEDRRATLDIWTGSGSATPTGSTPGSRQAAPILQAPRSCRRWTARPRSEASAQRPEARPTARHSAHSARQRTPRPNARRHPTRSPGRRQRRPTTIYTHQQRQPARTPPAAHAGQVDRQRTGRPTRSQPRRHCAIVYIYI